MVRVEASWTFLSLGARGLFSVALPLTSGHQVFLFFSVVTFTRCDSPRWDIRGVESVDMSVKFQEEVPML
jgi:hypothetical protein